MLVHACLAAGCWVGEREYPFLRDARSAAEQKDAPRAYGAARAVLDNQKALESEPAELEEATRIALDAERLLAERRLEEAATQPPTKEGLQRRITLLEPIIAADRTTSPLGSLRARAIETIVDGVLPLWANVEPHIRKESYGAAFSAIGELQRFVGPSTRLDPKVDAAKLRVAAEHEARAAEAGTSVLGKAWRRWHLAAASQLGAKHDLRALDRELEEALSVGITVGQLDAGSGCSTSRSDVEAKLLRPGNRPVTLNVRVRCDVKRDTTNEKRSRTVYDEKVVSRPVQREVIVGYRSVSSRTGGGQQCLTTSDPVKGTVRDTGRCWNSSGTVQTRDEPIYKTVTEMEQEVVRTPRTVHYDVVRKTKLATVKIDVEADGLSKTYEAQRGFEDFATRGDSGDAARKFTTEPEDASLVREARAAALDKATEMLADIVRVKRQQLLEGLRADSTEADVEEAYRAAQVFARTSSASEAERWLGSRWRSRAPAGDEKTAIDALSVSLTARSPLEAEARYEYEPPLPVRHLNVAHGAGWLVTTGISLDLGVQAALLDSTRAHASLGGTVAPFGNRTWALRASAAGASPAILGSASGYAVGLAYARSLRGPIDDHHRLELVASLGVVGGVTKLDDGLAPTLDKERFVRVPFVLSASVPLYYVALQAQLGVEPNVLALAAPGDGWRTPHVGSLWFGVLPLPWLSVLGGVESALGAPSDAPRPGVRLGVRL